LRGIIKFRRATLEDSPAIDRMIAEWLNWLAPREESIKRAVSNGELLVACRDSEVVGFIHSVMHEDIIDGGLNSFITCFYVTPELRGTGVGSELLERAITDALAKRAVGIETSTASPEARRLYETHHFRQFMGNWSMGEVFLELDMEEHRQGRKSKGNSTRREDNMPPRNWSFDRRTDPRTRS
jgi:GNAT superfamily N-acetyltransferase